MYAVPYAAPVTRGSGRVKQLTHKSSIPCQAALHTWDVLLIHSSGGWSHACGACGALSLRTASGLATQRAGRCPAARPRGLWSQASVTLGGYIYAGAACSCAVWHWRHAHAHTTCTHAHMSTCTGHYLPISARLRHRPCDVQVHHGSASSAASSTSANVHSIVCMSKCTTACAHTSKRPLAAQRSHRHATTDSNTRRTGRERESHRNNDSWHRKVARDDVRAHANQQVKSRKAINQSLPQKKQKLCDIMQGMPPPPKTV